ncbi:unnamed protein product [Prunus armeniaca]|uniref:Knottin scorpion toxin-like domain-containing protein n=1 Tax=Prunus armeniaca TaxID=36596 RepID=A0A6J5XT49_PRUAR|nr:unnamed protein product [Prunus armeniaca]CAB4314358.1 unnamed protein product [Prunus armeniaca]
MAKFTIPCFVLILVLLSTTNVWKIATVEGSKCCTDHPELGKCIPGADDNPDSGKCWKFCTSDCEKGGICKLFGDRHHCHCLC